jgi:hypothetical protein
VRLVILLFLISFNLYAENQEAVIRLQEIREAINDRRGELDVLQRKMRHTRDNQELNELQEQQDELSRTINRLNQSFEQIAIGSVDLSTFAEQPVVEFDWQKELIIVTQPLLDMLKNLTEKPRRIEQLRSEIIRLENQQSLANRAVHAIATLQQQDMSKELKERLNLLLETWQKREADIHGSLETARYQLNNLDDEHSSSLEAITLSLKSFASGRGITLLLAIITVVGIWGGLYLLKALILSLFRPRNLSRNWMRTARIIRYIFIFIGILLTVFALITVFYARNDVLLLVLVILAIFAILLSLRNTIPGYITEIRLLLNLGSVRQDERIVYQGIPYHVRTISVYTTLINPELDGVIRLPIETLSNLISRPRTNNEAWFPSQVGDYLMLDGDTFAEVVQQTIEFVQLRVKGSLVEIATPAFLKREVRNLSRDGFTVIVSFGIDYKHQAECLNTVQTTLHTAITLAFAEFAYEPRSLLVKFKAANTNSLDYLILANMPGEAAADYFAIERLIQTTCVEVCNRQQWVIPFQQLTLHRGK